MADTLWTGDELRALFGEADHGAMPDAIGGISIDTRTLSPGDLFFAIKGDRTDGHDYIGKAFEAGAALAVVERGYAGSAPGPLLRVADTLRAMEELGSAGRNRSGARIVAVTGSVGKTGTKEMLRLLFARLGSVHASDKSYNNHWGVPLSLARLPRNADYAVFEIGMNHAGEITPLTQMVRPHIAVITTVAPVHMEFFASIEEIAEAKAEIFRGLEPAGAAIVNRDNPHFEQLATRARECGAGRIAGFGKSGESDVRLLALSAGAAGSEIEADILGEHVAYVLGAPGEHLAMNSLAALAAVKLAGGDIAQAAAVLTGFSAPQGRGAQSVHRIGNGGFLLIDESYNANPASMAASLRVLAALPNERAVRRIAILGDMLELGERSADLHRALALEIESGNIDKVFCCGPHMKSLFGALPHGRSGAWAENSDGLQDALLANIQPGDAIMIKGSLGSRMGLLVDALKRQFPQTSSAGQAAAE